MKSWVDASPPRPSPPLGSESARPSDILALNPEPQGDGVRRCGLREGAESWGWSRVDGARAPASVLVPSAMRGQSAKAAPPAALTRAPSGGRPRTSRLQTARIKRLLFLCVRLFVCLFLFIYFCGDIGETSVTCKQRSAIFCDSICFPASIRPRNLGSPWPDRGPEVGTKARHLLLRQAQRHHVQPQAASRRTETRTHSHPSGSPALSREGLSRQLFPGYIRKVR